MMMLPEGSLCTIEDIWSIINDNDGNEDGYNGGGGGNKDCIDDDDDDDDDWRWPLRCCWKHSGNVSRRMPHNPETANDLDCRKDYATKQSDWVSNIFHLREWQQWGPKQKESVLAGNACEDLGSDDQLCQISSQRLSQDTLLTRIIFSSQSENLFVFLENVRWPQSRNMFMEIRRVRRRIFFPSLAK